MSIDAAAAAPASAAAPGSSDATVASLHAWSNSRFVGGLDRDRSAADSSALPPLVQYSSSAARNQADIGAALLTLLPPAGPKAIRDPLRVLELASGTGQHIAHFASLLPRAVLQPSDQTRDGFASIEHHTRGRANVLPPVTLDLEAADVGSLFASGTALEPHGFDLLCVANMLHISGPRTSAGMFAAAASALRRPEEGGGRLLVYGPFKLDGEFTTDSNRAFDAKLKTMHPDYGLRDVGQLDEVGRAFGLQLLETRHMPSNNFMLAFSNETHVTNGAAAATGSAAHSLPGPAASAPDPEAVDEEATVPVADGGFRLVCSPSGHAPVAAALHGPH